MENIFSMNVVITGRKSDTLDALARDLGLTTKHIVLSAKDLRSHPISSFVYLSKAVSILWMDTRVFASYCPQAFYHKSTVVIHHILDHEDWKYQASRASQIVVTDEDTKKKVLQYSPSSSVLRCRTGFSSEHFRRLERSERSAVRRQLGIGDDKLLVCLNGAVRPHKQFEAIVEILKKLSLVRSDLVLVTCGKFWPNLVDETSTLKVVNLEANASISRVAEIVAASDLLISNSTCEGGPLPVAEALACGTRVLTTRVGQVAEWLAECPPGAGVSYGVPCLTYEIVEKELYGNSESTRIRTAVSASAFEYSQLRDCWREIFDQEQSARQIRGLYIAGLVEFGIKFWGANFRILARHLAHKRRTKEIHD